MMYKCINVYIYTDSARCTLLNRRFHTISSTSKYRYLVRIFRFSMLMDPSLRTYSVHFSLLRSPEDTWLYQHFSKLLVISIESCTICWLTFPWDLTPEFPHTRIRNHEPPHSYLFYTSFSLDLVIQSTQPNVESATQPQPQHGYINTNMGTSK